MRSKRNFLQSAFVCVAAFLAAATASAEVASDWAEGHYSRTRLIGGGGLIGVELELPEGWKTYWRYPGEAGGVAPSFDWSKSSNLESAEVLYPAPLRMSDAGGETIGYKGSVTFPVRLKAKDPAKPIDVRLGLEYGVCKDICIPAEAQLALTLPANSDAETSEPLIAAMSRIPATPDARRENDPLIKRVTPELAGDKPRIVIEAQIPGGTDGVDAFVDAPGGFYVPLPKQIAASPDGTVTFEVDLSRDVDVADFKGKPLTATVVSGSGQSQMTFSLE
ncbi:putative thiol:disulfide interchange protein [Hyphomicrobium sulfonivorans]|uniref:Putative thiol:disulfide interchange protein n=1 Tax=Hyphomicrobium sulfonivorans TaxID=121290 RepID=A0A109B8X0_HYPSL|nr:protein-disulfide reductase DsbD domain-containing protein [Hyphomicrobium sulfonivorans]KWT64368.1 putative thiol:disulfide interchange protein [Hyphomicrobium sulfonivorans]